MHQPGLDLGEDTAACAGAGPLRLPLSAGFDAVPDGWRTVTEAFRATPAGQALIDFVDGRVRQGATVYPAGVFRALALCPLPAVRVVVLGQDPYHGPGQAEGLAFSVPPGQRLPPSLRNMGAELQRDLGHGLPDGGSLVPWARQGVLLLNTTLTVEQGQPASHARRGWETLTDALLAAVAQRGQPVAYLLWGAHAQAKRALIQAHTPPGVPVQVLQANHPSPLAARRPPVPFIGCGHFGAVVRWWGSQGQSWVWSGAATATDARPDVKGA